MSSLRERLIQTREEELDQTQIVLSLKRTLELQKEEEALSNESSSTFKRLKPVKYKNVMEAAYQRTSEHFRSFCTLPFRVKMFSYLTANSIIDLSWNYVKLIDLKKSAWSKYASKNRFKEPNLKAIPGALTTLNHIKEKESLEPVAKYIAFCSELIPKTSDVNVLRTFRIYGEVLSISAFKQREMDRWRRMSERDLFDCTWNRVISIIFEDSKVILARGEMENSGSKELEKIKDSDDSRGPFKVDLRAVIESTTSSNPLLIKSFDLSNCEVAKDGKISKTTVDNAKLLVEAKVILDQIIRKSGYDVEKARKISVINLQISGLKARLVELKLAHDQCGYVAQPIGKLIYFPASHDYMENFFNISLPLLYHWKETTENNAKLLQDGLNVDDSAFGGPANEVLATQNFLKPTWMGPKTKDSKKVPPLPALEF